MAAKLPNSSRRKFMVAGSAAVAAPLLVNVPGILLDAKAETKAETSPQGVAGGASEASAGFTTYFITRDCTGCQTCRGLCPAKAIHWGNGQNEIDQSKCIHCGTCYRECPTSVISEVIQSGHGGIESKADTIGNILGVATVAGVAAHAIVTNIL